MKTRNSWVMGTVLAVSAAFAAPVQASPELVTNGGFEMRDFSGWVETGDTSFNGVQCPGPGPGVYEGNCSAFFGPFSVGGIEQSIDVGSTGLMWTLSFAFQPDGASPSSLTVLFGGETLLSLTDPSAGDYTVYQFSGVTTAQNMTLAFNFVDPVGFLFLDSVSVTTVAEPAPIGLMGAALAGLFISRRRKKA